MTVKIKVVKADGNIQDVIISDSKISSISNVTGQTLCKNSAGKLLSVIPHTQNVVSIELID